MHCSGLQAISFFTRGKSTGSYWRPGCLPFPRSLEVLGRGSRSLTAWTSALLIASGKHSHRVAAHSTSQELRERFQSVLFADHLRNPHAEITFDYDNFSAGDHSIVNHYIYGFRYHAIQFHNRSGGQFEDFSER